jgi:hypothetical protein
MMMIGIMLVTSAPPHTLIWMREHIFFHVKATNNDGVETDKVKTIRIIVLPPWWKTWWAYTLYLIVFGGLLYLFYWYSVKTSKLTHELNFQHLSHEKDQELAQRKLSFFTNISHEIKNAPHLNFSAY